MMLAPREDYDYPHIDWVCENGDCGSKSGSSGVPDTDHCAEGHVAMWRPNDDQIEAYIDLLESMDEGDGIVISGDGPAPLMGRVESTGDNELQTESLDSPPRLIRWDRDEHTIEWSKADDEHQTFDQVHHVETAEVEVTT